LRITIQLKGRISLQAETRQSKKMRLQNDGGKIGEISAGLSAFKYDLDEKQTQSKV
jgi:hypothetical protein